MRREIPILTATIVGLIMIADNFIKMAAVNQAAVTIRTWVVIVATLALPLGAFNLLRVHWPRITARKDGWVNSAVLYGAMISTIVIGLTMGTKNKTYALLYDGIMVPGSSTAYALLAFFIASAAARSFRARSLESTLLLVTAILLMLGNAPIGALISPILPKVGAWIISIPNTAAQRGLIITSALAFIAINLRNILGLSSEWLGSNKD